MSKQKRQKPEEIASILKQHEAGLTTAEICRQYGYQQPDVVPLEVEVRRHRTDDADRVHEST